MSSSSEANPLNSSRVKGITFMLGGTDMKTFASVNMRTSMIGDDATDLTKYGNQFGNGPKYGITKPICALIVLKFLK